jgi:hypothetical protein
VGLRLYLTFHEAVVYCALSGQLKVWIVPFSPAMKESVLRFASY